MSKFSMYPPTLDGDSVSKKREEIRNYFHNTYNLFEKIFEVLKDDSSFYLKSERTRHPMIFYFGHTATFFINKLINMKIIQKRINPHFESIFAVGVDEMSWDDVDSNNYEWGEVSEVRKYRDSVRELVDSLITTLPLTLPITQDSPFWIILMGIEHERIHIETSLVLHRQMPLEFIKELDALNMCEGLESAPTNEMVNIAGSSVTLGKDTSHNYYGWDNEYGSYSEQVDSFAVSKYLVSNSEYMEFVLDGGYENLEFWDDEGRAFLNSTKAEHPTFWVKEDAKFRYRTLTKIIDMPLNFPVDVNALEAEAFCRYKSKKDSLSYSLPSEAEYRVLYAHAKMGEISDEKESNVNLSCFSASAVDRYNHNGIYDVVGNVWQWSRTLIRGFEGFEVHEAYDDFSTPTFDEKHAIILGSSWASSGNLIMKHSRYAFRKHFFQNAGFRYVISKNRSLNREEELYESDALVSQSCESQYGDTHFGVENFAIASAKIASKFALHKTKALDLGCTTGRATFELAKSFEKVEGVDSSVRFVQVGSNLKDKGTLFFHSLQEGNLTQKKRITTEDLAYEHLVDKVSFWQGDACNLKPNFNSYDLVMATNLIERLYNPRLFLDTISQRINDEGILVIISTYNWQENLTKKELWLGGYTDENGVDVKTLESLKKILSCKFELIHTQDLESVIKESTRKYQHNISEVSVWKKIHD